jgi:hypothetical protein
MANRSRKYGVTLFEFLHYFFGNMSLSEWALIALFVLLMSS